MPWRVKKGPVSKASFEAAVKRIDEQLEHARASKAKLEQRSLEYEELKAVLEGLPNKVSHPVMVPFGPLAFFQGYLEHTNEVLTQLSSEWFALRTTKSALEMVGRRHERLGQDRADVEQELQELGMRRRLAASEGGAASAAPRPSSDVSASLLEGASVRYDDEGFLDIREPFLEEDSGDAAALPASERRPMASDPLAVAPEASAAAASSGPRSPITDAAVGAAGGSGDIFARLRELERMEDLEELEELDRFDEMSPGAEGGGVEGDGTADEAEVASSQLSLGAAVRSPADIFNVMSRVEQEAVGGTVAAAASGDVGVPRSKFSNKEHNKPLSADGADLSSVTGAGFARDIVERVGNVSAPFVGSTAVQTPFGHQSEGAGPSASAAASTSDPKRISKFKADRQRAHG